MRSLILSAILVATTSPLSAAAPETTPPPTTRKESVTDKYHGISVTEQYRWLEDWSDARVKSWSDSQNAHARAYLDVLPDRPAIEKRVSEIQHAISSVYYDLAWSPKGVFAKKSQPPLQQDLLVWMPSADRPDQERVIVDPNALDPTGGTAIDWFVPAPDGKLVAASLSAQGSEIGNVHVFDIATGKATDIVIPRVNGGTAGGDLVWMPDSRGFYYTRYPYAGERPEEDAQFFLQVWSHQLGQPLTSDRYEMGQDLPRIAEIQLAAEPSSGQVLATVQYGDSGRFAYYLRNSAANWLQIAGFDDGIAQMNWMDRSTLLLVTTKGSPRGRIQTLSLDGLDLAQAKTIIPERKEVIVSGFSPPSPVVVTPEHIYLKYQFGGPTEIRAFDHAGNPITGPIVLPVSKVGEMVAADEGDLLYSNESFVDPNAWYRFDAATGKTTRTALATKSPVDFADSEVVREFAISKDGTKIPVNIIRRKGAPLDGRSPALLTGYGGYGINIEPYFSSSRRIWLDQGFAVAVANIRGGGEYGEEWHLQGNLTKKQNVFDDFAAAMKLLVDRKYTSRSGLTIIGGSNGGLLMGAMITQHPEAFRVVVSEVGIYDMLRVELSPNGAFNVPEFGTVKDRDQFQAMYAYSPYHRVVDGTKYPSIFFMTGANDPRVDPMQSRKMTARLQDASASGHPILLRTSSSTGHGLGTPLDEQIREQTDIFSFVLNELGVKFQKSSLLSRRNIG
jgi:prolyl oligopeptidase